MKATVPQSTPSPATGIPAHSCTVCANGESHTAAQFTVDYEGELDWKNRWAAYLDTYITTCGVGEEPALREDVHRHLDDGGAADLDLPVGVALVAVEEAVLVGEVTDGEAREDLGRG